MRKKEKTSNFRKFDVFKGCMVNVVGGDSKGTTVPLAGGLEDSVLQGLKMLQKNTGVNKKQSCELFFAVNPRLCSPDNSLFF